MMRREKEQLGTLRSEGAERREREHKRRLQRLIPLLIFAFFGLLIAKQEIPAVDRWISQIINPEGWQAREACVTRARTELTQPGFARLLKSGEAQSTSDGYHVSRVVFAELRESGEEYTHSFGCNVNSAGVVVTLSHDSDVTESVREPGRVAQPDEVLDP